jgi:dTDP-4-amino-4,6-dideoxygalactose transaminase
VYCGATPVFADIVGPHELALDPAAVERAITPRTKAVCVVHFAGYPAQVEAIEKLCEDRGLALIEDAAHAPDAQTSGRKLGTWGLAGAFSFFSNKVLACGEGGLLATDDDRVAELARSLRSHGMTSGSWSRHTGQTTEYDVHGLGFNYRIDEPRAALLLSRFRRLDDEIGRRRELTRAYRAALADVDGLIVPYTDEAVERSSCYVMPVLVADSERRDEIRHELRERHGVQTSIFYPAVHEFTAYRERSQGLSLPHTEHAARAEITIPLHMAMDAAAQERVVAALKDVVA